MILFSLYYTISNIGICPLISGCQKKPVIIQVEELHCSMAVIMCPYANRQILKVCGSSRSLFTPLNMKLSGAVEVIQMTSGLGEHSPCYYT